MTSTHVEAVRRYYDSNTAAFERLGQGGACIHCAVWGPGVTTRADAFHYVDDLLLVMLPDSEAGEPLVLDLGCGLGASLIYLASRTPSMRGEGLTISPRQAEGAAQLVANAELAHRIRCREGDFLVIPDDLVGAADLTFSIEAFLHGPDAGAYFRAAAATLRTGGRLALCDFFLADPAAELPPRSDRRLTEFRDGWRVGSLHTVEQVRAIAAESGLALIGDRDLTPYLELRRPRDRFIAAVVALGRPLRLRGEYWRMVAGGDALQWCLLHGLVEYRLLELGGGR